MSVIRSEKISSTDENLAAVSEVEPVFRDYARSDMANLRRPASLPSSTETALEPSTEASGNNINSLIQRVAGPSVTEIENLISELESMRELLHAEARRVQSELPRYRPRTHPPRKSTR